MKTLLVAAASVLLVAGTPRASAHSSPKPSWSWESGPATVISERGRPSLFPLLHRNRVFYASSYLQAERWLYLISPSDRALLLRHDFTLSGVLAIFDRNVGWGVQMTVTT